MDTSTFNKGVQILLKRMESNPEEFMNDVKWNTIVEHVRKKAYRFITEEEATAVDNKMMELEAQLFTNTVMSTLLKQEVSPVHVGIPTGDFLSELQLSNGGFSGLTPLSTTK
jgi:adenine-specific DNA methylase